MTSYTVINPANEQPVRLIEHTTLEQPENRNIWALNDLLKRCSLELGGKSAAILLPDADLAVRAPELFQVGPEYRRVVLVAGDADQGLEEAPALHVHGGREHGPDLAVHGEQLPVEIGHRRVSGRFEQKQ